MTSTKPFHSPQAMSARPGTSWDAGGCVIGEAGGDAIEQAGV